MVKAILRHTSTRPPHRTILSKPQIDRSYHQRVYGETISPAPMAVDPWAPPVQSGAPRSRQVGVGDDERRLIAPNHCHDFDAKAFVLGGEITLTRDNNPTTFRTGQCFEVPTGCMHAEHVGPEGVALLSGRRRNGPLTREAFESDLRREGFEVIHGGQKPDFAEDLHAHDFDVRIMVLSGEITVTRDGKPESSRPAIIARWWRVASTPRRWDRRASPTSSQRLIGGSGGLNSIDRSPIGTTGLSTVPRARGRRGWNRRHAANRPTSCRLFPTWRPETSIGSRYSVATHYKHCDSGHDFKNDA
jgi:quercetin dioxygenase-like cupin family protein